MTECGAQKITPFGWHAWCALDAGEHLVHASADFIWTAEQAVAGLRGPGPEDRKAAATAAAGMACPGCEQPPRYLLGGGTQAFCGNMDCHVFTWNPTLSLQELAADTKYIDLSGWLQ